MGRSLRSYHGYRGAQGFGQPAARLQAVLSAPRQQTPRCDIPCVCDGEGGLSLSVRSSWKQQSSLGLKHVSPQVNSGTVSLCQGMASLTQSPDPEYVCLFLLSFPPLFF